MFQWHDDYQLAIIMVECLKKKKTRMFSWALEVTDKPVCLNKVVRYFCASPTINFCFLEFYVLGAHTTHVSNRVSFLLNTLVWSDCGAKWSVFAYKTALHHYRCTKQNSRLRRHNYSCSVRFCNTIFKESTNLGNTS